MRRPDTTLRNVGQALKLFLICIVASVVAPAATAQHGLFVSASSDFSTHDRLFGASDVIHIQVVPGSRLDLTAVTKSEFTLEPLLGGEGYEGVLEIREDGSFTARVAVSELEGQGTFWHLHVSIEDGFDAAYRTRTAVVIRGRSGGPETFRVQGFVEAASATSITVSGHVFAVTADTEIHLDGVGDPSDLAGRRVVVVAERADGRVTALQIFLRADTRVRIVGTIEAIGASSVTLNETTFSIASQTTIRTWLGTSLTLGDLAVGTSALITARRTSDGWVAVEVVTRSGRAFPGDRGDEQEIEGRVESVTAASITVGGMTFTVDADTEIEGAADLAGVEVGTFVEIEFIVGDAGEFIAVSIEVDDGGDQNGDDEDEIEVEGVITAVSDHSVTVEGIEFVVSADTEIEGNGVVEIGLGDLYTGLYVEAEGRRDADGTVRATSIEIDEDEEGRDRLVIRGEITEILGTTVTVGETSFLVTDQTRIRGRRGGGLTLRDVAAGMFARAHLTSSAGGGLVAVQLIVEHRFEDDDVALAGRIESVSETEITVHGVTFDITEETEIEDVRGSTVATSDLQIGQVVRIEGERTDGGRYVAFEIRVRTRIHHEGHYGGIVTDVSEHSISVNGAAFAVSGETILKGVSSMGEIAAGDRIRLRYRSLGDGSRLAIRIWVHASIDANTELSGIIDDVTDGALEVAGVRVHLTLATRVHDERGRPMGGMALRAGQMVNVTGTSTAAGVVAARVDVERPLVVSGAASIESDGRLLVAGSTYALDDRTLIIGRGNVELTTDALEAGAYVEIIAVDRSSGTSGDTEDDDAMYTERVLVMQMSEGTASELDEPGVASTFTLDQNYPNPFNPTTTIRFEVGSSGDRDVSLTIFDVLGRKVRTLVDASLSPGSYDYTWDGRDAVGRPASSGVYLYRLQVGGQTATRSMTLLK